MLLVLISGIFMQFHVWSGSSILSLSFSKQNQLVWTWKYTHIKDLKSALQVTAVMPVLAACYIEMEGISSVLKTVSSRSVAFPLLLLEKTSLLTNVMSTLCVTRNEEHILISISFMYWNEKSLTDLQDCSMT
jgi:hypothetical protein